MVSRKYRYLLALAKEKHFGNAAIACNVSASTLSAAIRELESELGVTVVERGHHFGKLTAEGQRVVDYAHRILANEEILLQDLANMRGSLVGHIRIGVIPTALTVVSQLTTALGKRYPKATMEVLSLSMKEICQQIRNFELEAGIVYVGQEFDEKGLAVMPIWQESHILFTSQVARFAGRESITWDEVATMSLCLLTPDMQNRKNINQTFQRLGYSPVPVLETNSILNLVAHASQGYGAALVPKSVVECLGIPAGVTALRLSNPELNWKVGLVTPQREQTLPLVEALMKEGRVIANSFDFSE